MISNNGNYEENYIGDTGIEFIRWLGFPFCLGPGSAYKETFNSMYGFYHSDYD